MHPELEALILARMKASWPNLPRLQEARALSDAIAMTGRLAYTESMLELLLIQSFVPLARHTQA